MRAENYDARSNIRALIDTTTPDGMRMARIAGQAARRVATRRLVRFRPCAERLGVALVIYLLNVAAVIVSPDRISVACLVGAALVLVLCAGVTSRAWPRMLRWSSLPFALIAFSGLVTLELLVYAHAPLVHANWFGSYGLKATISGWLSMASVLLGYALLDTVRHTSAAPAAHHVLDEVFVGLLYAAGYIGLRGQSTWRYAPSARYLRARLERAARLAEAAFLDRVALTDLAGRRQARVAGLKLAAIIRSRRDLVATAADQEVYAELHEWLVDGVTKWAFGGLDEVIRATPIPPQRDLWWRAMRWLVPALVLVAAAVCLPLIPQIAATTGAVAGIRITLLTAAVLYLTVGPSAVADQVMSVVNQVSGFKTGRS